MEQSEKKKKLLAVKNNIVKVKKKIKQQTK